jgi:endonuclease/exonuclease/phosphatase (EEP) superfamily protein YafD
MSTTRLSPAGSIAKTFGFLMFLLGWTAVLATLLGFFGTVWWPLDVLADWRFILAFVLILATIATGLGYSRVSAVVFLVAAIVNIYFVAPMWLNDQQPLVSSDRIRVVTLDIGLAPDVRPAVLEWVNMIEGDIIILANAGGAWASAIDQLGVPYRVVNEDPGLTGGTLVLARNEIGATIEPVPAGMRAADVIVRVPLADQQVRIVGFSVERPVSASTTKERLIDFTAVNVGVRRMSGSVAVVGNLEASRWSHAFKTLATDLTNSEDGFGYVATYPAYDLPIFDELVGIPVDHVLYQGPITVTNRRISPNLGTDHAALVVDLSPAGG